MRKLSWLFCVVFLVVGCGENRHRSEAWPASIESIHGFSADEEAKVRSAIDYLNRSSGTSVVQTTGAGTTSFPISIRKVEPTDSNPTRAGLATVSSDHCSIDVTSIVFDSSSEDLLTPVLVHEIGHCAGLNHVPSNTEIMYKASVSLDKYSSEALARFFHSLRASAGL